MSDRKLLKIQMKDNMDK